MSPKFVIGIDLGTTNSVLAATALDESNAETPSIELLNVEQVAAAGTLEGHSNLPSFTYLATDAEKSAGSLDLPWASNRDFAVGQFARVQSAEVPQRTVGAAKSWLGYAGVDRRETILPWQAPEDVNKISPVTASRRYLEHLADAWNHAHPEAPLAEQSVVLTVPASFDASARELTREAAIAAGLPDSLVLLEEPQAAVYAWLAALGPNWRKGVEVGEQILICDVGGGTTDLTLVAVAEQNGELHLERVAVGNHLLVGGDNMDLALAHYVAGEFAKKKVQLDPWQNVSLWHKCRAAKEQLLGNSDADTFPISVQGKGSKLIGSTVSVEISRSDVANLLVDGFFPVCDVSERPVRQPFSGFQEIGLPYEADTAVTRHVAAFLADHGTAGQPVKPAHVLFNGGVFKAEKLRSRMLESLSVWTGSEVKPLSGAEDLDYSVARGATYYGWAKQTGGVRIRGGIPRSYYVGIERAGLAIPGAPRPLSALCVAEMGMEEGTETAVPSSEIGLVVGQPATFRIFSSVTRKDPPGQLLQSFTEEELAESDSVETTLTADQSSESYVPVKFESRVTELGMFELWCANTKGEERWKLEFNTREEN